MKQHWIKRNICRVRAIVLAAVFCLCAVPFSAFAAESGRCGDGLTWSYSLGTLTISGQGKMTDYDEFDQAPWSHLRESIVKVVLPNGLTSVGRLAFYNCTSLKTVILPDSVRTLAQNAFYGCSKLEFVDFSSTLSVIGSGAFYGCKKLATLNLPISLESIGNQAFYLCERIATVTVPQNVHTIGTQAFGYCTSLIRVKINAPIQSLPKGLFYGCENLVEIVLPSTLAAVETYAFKKCDGLTNVYHTGSAQTIATVKKDIAESVPNFMQSGYIGAGDLGKTSYSSQVVSDEEGKMVSQANTTVQVEQGVTLVTTVEKQAGKDGKAPTYETSLVLTVEGNNAWQTAADTVKSVLSQVNADYSQTAVSTETKVTVYVSDTATVDQKFLQDMAGRNLEVEIVTPEGNTWRVDCQVINATEVTGSVNLNYTVGAASPDAQKALGTGNCYYVNFADSSALKTEVLIQLPSSAAGNNAFLYQVEQDGTNTRLQAVAVDNDANAHFFLASVDKNTQYVVGVNVPGERTDDLIIPKELSDTYGAIMRLEKIEYVATGARTMGGLSLTMVIVIVLIILLLTSILVGVIMFMMNKRKLNQRHLQA